MDENKPTVTPAEFLADKELRRMFGDYTVYLEYRKVSALEDIAGYLASFQDGLLEEMQEPTWQRKIKALQQKTKAVLDETASE